MNHCSTFIGGVLEKPIHDYFRSSGGTIFEHDVVPGSFDDFDLSVYDFLQLLVDCKCDGRIFATNHDQSRFDWRLAFEVLGRDLFKEFAGLVQRLDSLIRKTLLLVRRKLRKEVLCGKRFMMVKPVRVSCGEEPYGLPRKFQQKSPLL